MNPSIHARVFAVGAGARDRKKKSAIPDLLIGCWRSGGGRYSVTGEGGYFAIEGPHNWSVSANGQTLVWNGWTLNRISGSGATYIGVWGGTDTGSSIEISFNADGSWQWRWVADNELMHGYYVANGNQLAAYEKRGDMVVTGNQITLTSVWGDVLTGTYTLNGDNWRIDYGAEGVVSYLRVAC